MKEYDVVQVAIFPHIMTRLEYDGKEGKKGE